MLGYCRREMEVESARPPPAQQALTPRQLARMADLSLLLDVVLKSQVQLSKSTLFCYHVMHNLVPTALQVWHALQWKQG